MDKKLNVSAELNHCLSKTAVAIKSKYLLRHIESLETRFVSFSDHNFVTFIVLFCFFSKFT